MMRRDEMFSPRGQQRRLLLKTLGAGAAASLVTRRPAWAETAAEAGVVDVAIIGAGLAGLTAARDLSRAGCESFVVIEARNRVGGRTYNHDLGHGIISEGGGQWIGPGQTAVADLARELEIGTFDTYYSGKTIFMAGESTVAQDMHGGSGLSPEIAQKLNELARGVPSDAPWKAAKAHVLDTMSVGDWLSKQRLSNDDKIGLTVGVTLTGGAAPAEMGLLQYLAAINSADSDYERLEAFKNSAQQSRFVGGSQRLSIRMAHDLRDKVRLSSPVRKITGWNRDLVELQTDAGVLRARCVIAALGPGLCAQIAFDPPLPKGRSELQRLWPAAPMRKTVHVYPRPFWRDEGLNGQIWQVGGPVLMAYDNSPPDGAVGIINAFIVPGALRNGPENTKRTLSAIYAKALGDKALHPTQFRDLDWGKIDPWSLSCVPPIPPRFWTKWGEFLRPAAGRIIWSGTETADVWAGAMDGAVRSGHRAALQALNVLAHTS